MKPLDKPPAKLPCPSCKGEKTIRHCVAKGRGEYITENCYRCGGTGEIEQSVNSKKTLLAIIVLALCGVQVHAQSMGSIDDPVVGGTAANPRGDRIAFLKADIAEKNKIIAKDYARDAAMGVAPHCAAYLRIIAADQAELAELQGR
jgi:hypothetical protein